MSNKSKRLLSILESKGINTYINIEVNNESRKVLIDLTTHIKSLSDIGHSFTVIVDPESDDKKEFFIDGDGAFRIKSINIEVK